MSEIVERLRHCSDGTRDEYLHELTGRAAALIEQQASEIAALTAQLAERDARIAALTAAGDAMVKELQFKSATYHLIAGWQQAKGEK